MGLALLCLRNRAVASPAVSSNSPYPLFYEYPALESAVIHTQSKDRERASYASPLVNVASILTACAALMAGALAFFTISPFGGKLRPITKAGATRKDGGPGKVRHG